MKSVFKSVQILVIASLLFFVGFVLPTLAESTYIPLSPIPGLSDSGAPQANGGSGFSGYIVQLYQWGVALTSGLAVVVIMWGGIGYVTSAGGGGIEEAKGRISAAIMGLLLALSSYIILRTINQDLLNVSFNLNPITVGAGSGISSNNVGRVVGASNGTGVNNATNLGRGREGVDEDGFLIDANGNHIFDENGDPIQGATNFVNIGLPLRDAWGDDRAGLMEGYTLSGRQTYYASNEKITDSYTQAGLSSFGKLVEGTPTTVGSAASVYYPPGTLIQVGDIKYIIDDNNLTKNGNEYRPANNNLTNNYTIDIYTTDVQRANTTDTHNNITVLYVPDTWVSSSDITNIRNNPNQYISSN
jgi:hypothetical protein